MDATDLKVYGEGEWKVKKHGTYGKHRVWRKLHIAVDTSSHHSCRAKFLNGYRWRSTPELLNQTRRSILEVSGDGAYDTRACHAAIKIKGAVALIPLRGGAAIWSVVTHEISP
ncbi:transposase [Vibrio splendidus]|uniref:transposase n=1 Tax=Vibrio splendidus TaxID=29497 RepID=UPI003CC9114A